MMETLNEIPIYVAIDGSGKICKAIANREYDHLKYLIDACILEKKYGHLTIMPITISNVEHSVTGLFWEDVDCNMKRLRQALITSKDEKSEIFYGRLVSQWCHAKGKDAPLHGTCRSFWEALKNLLP